MNCANCGHVIMETSRFCVNCGSGIDSSYAPIQRVALPNNKIGYSARISDPAFNKYISDSNKWTAFFSLFIATVAVIGFYIAGENSNEMDNPESLFVGLAIGGMFLLIAYFQISSKKRSATWDGKVVDKSVEVKKKRVDSGDEYTWEEYTLYTVLIQSNAGKRHEIKVENDDTIYTYYNINDDVRHHKGLNTFEKYNKTGDSIIFCNACASLNNIQDDYCHRCKCPLLK